MNNEQKAQKYNQLMYEYTRIQNQISSIKGESLELNERQLNEVRDLESKLRFLMNLATNL
jgi:prefoldin subunit 5